MIDQPQDQATAAKPDEQKQAAPGPFKYLLNDPIQYRITRDWKQVHFSRVPVMLIEEDPDPANPFIDLSDQSSWLSHINVITHMYNPNQFADVADMLDAAQVPSSERIYSIVSHMVIDWDGQGTKRPDELEDPSLSYAVSSLFNGMSTFFRVPGLVPFRSDPSNDVLNQRGAVRDTTAA